MKRKKKDLELTPEQIQAELIQKLKKYKKRSFLEKFALYLGVTQILEFGLKNHLITKFGYSYEKLENLSLGQTKKELVKSKIRQDFIALLTNVIDNRNYIVHNLLLDYSLTNSLVFDLIPKDHYRKEFRILDKAIIELEQVMIIFDWTNKNNGWENSAQQAGNRKA